jgi:hypothetical protein
MSEAKPREFRAAPRQSSLIAKFMAVDAARADTPLTYFELTTLAVMRRNS